MEQLIGPKISPAVEKAFIDLLQQCQHSVEVLGWCWAAAGAAIAAYFIGKVLRA